MSFGTFDSGGGQPMAEINTTPLVDVMLVLLVIFIITAPLLTHAIKLDLPQADASRAPETVDTITLSIDPAGGLYWNNEPVADLDSLSLRLAEAAVATPKPDLHLRAHNLTPYERIAQVMSAAQRAGMNSIGFVTNPASDANLPAAAVPGTDAGVPSQAPGVGSN